MKRALLSLRSYYYPSSLLLVGPLRVESVLVGAALARVMAGVLRVTVRRRCRQRLHSGACVNRRAYNYPHVTAVYWSLYRLGRRFRPARVKRHGWRWYLRRAHGTAMGMWEHGGEVFPHEQQRVAGQAWSKVGNGQGTAQWGLMVRLRT